MLVHLLQRHLRIPQIPKAYTTIITSRHKMVRSVRIVIHVPCTDTMCLIDDECLAGRGGGRWRAQVPSTKGSVATGRGQFVEIVGIPCGCGGELDLGFVAGDRDGVGVL